MNHFIIQGDDDTIVFLPRVFHELNNLPKEDFYMGRSHYNTLDRSGLFDANTVFYTDNVAEIFASLPKKENKGVITVQFYNHI